MSTLAPDLGMPSADLPGQQADPETATDFRWLMSPDVFKHCTPVRPAWMSRRRPAPAALLLMSFAVAHRRCGLQGPGWHLNRSSIIDRPTQLRVLTRHRCGWEFRAGEVAPSSAGRAPYALGRSDTTI